MGDFNINLLSYNNDHSVKDFVDVMYSFGLLSLVTKPTRITEISVTLIDTIFTNCIQNEFSSGQWRTWGTPSRGGGGQATRNKQKRGDANFHFWRASEQKKNL